MAVQSADLYGRYDHAHNEFAEFAIETGWVGLGWVLLIGGIHLLHALRLLWGRRRSGARALGLATALALLAAGLHALTDFILHIPALRFWIVVLMGAAAATGLRHRPIRRASVDPP
jgi:O-antigen ligase